MLRRAAQGAAVGIPAAALAGSVWYRETHRPKLPPHQLRDLSGSTVVMTGATSGIGKAAAAKLASLGATVVLGCRDAGRGEAAKEEIVAAEGIEAERVEVLQLDLADVSSVRAFARECQRRHPNDLAVVVSAAAEIVYEPGRRNSTGADLAFATNHLGLQALVAELEPALLRPLPQKPDGESHHRRVVIVGSRLETRGSVDPEVLLETRGAALRPDYATAEPMIRYADTKRCNALLTTALAGRWREQAVDVLSVTPGMVHTGLWRHFPLWYQTLTYPIRAVALRSAADAAEGVVFAAAAVEADGKSGAYLSDGVEIEPSQGSRDAQLAARLHEVCSRLISDCEGA